MFEKQYQLITRDRGTIEGLVVGSFLSDLSLYMDYNKLKESDFIIDKCKFYFSLGKIMSKNYSELDDVSISNVISNDRELREKYKEYGGWETIKKAMSIGNANNIDAYIDELYKNNFLIKRGQREIFTKTIEIDGMEINPFKDLFPTMTYKEVEEFFIGQLAKDAQASFNNSVKGESLILRADTLAKLKEGVNQGTPYDIIFEYTEKEIGLSDDDTPRYVYGSPWLSKTTNGLGNGGGISLTAGYSGIGKSTFTFFNQILPMVYRGETAVIYSNEQKSIYFSSMLYSFVSANVFKYYKLTRNKIENGQTNEYEDELIQKISDFLERRNFDEQLIFYSLEEFEVDEILRISKGLVSHNGATVFLIDTFKSENSGDANYTGKMIESTKKLDAFGNKFDVKVILTLQLTPGNEMRNSYLTASDLAECKSTKTVADLLFLMRKVDPRELDKTDKKYYLYPYQVTKRNRKIEGMGDWTEKEIELDKDGDYRLIFLNKSRRGQDDIVLLYRFYGTTGMFKELGMCKRVFKGNL